MSGIISRASIKVIAESVGISNLKDEVADALAPDVEYRLRDLVQEAQKFQRHGRRQTLTTEDINYALRLRNCEPLYGFTSPEPPRFCRALTPGVFYLEDPELNLADLLAEPLPPVPAEPSFTAHWLAVNGVQPAIPQNPAQEDIDAAAAARAASRKRPRDDADDAAADAASTTPLARHVLTQEEQTWLDKITAAMQAYKPDKEGLIDEATAKSLGDALIQVANDAVATSLSSHLSALVASQVNGSLRCLSRLTAAMRLLGAMLRSLSLDIEPYLHQVMPAVLTCLVGKRLCASPLEDHWTLRHTAAGHVRTILSRYRDKYESLQPRVCKTLLDALNDGRKPLSTHYGALIGLGALGPMVVHSLLMPHLPTYLAGVSRLLEGGGGEGGGGEGGGEGGGSGGADAMAVDTPPAGGASAAAAAGSTSKSRSHGAADAERTARRLEAMRVHSAALHICGSYFFRDGKIFSLVPPPPPAAASEAATTTQGEPPAAGGASAAAAAAIAAAGSGATKTVPRPPPPRNRKGGGGGGGGVGQPVSSAQDASLLLPLIGTRRDASALERSFTPPLSGCSHLCCACAAWCLTATRRSTPSSAPRSRHTRGIAIGCVPTHQGCWMRCCEWRGHTRCSRVRLCMPRTPT